MKRSQALVILTRQIIHRCPYKGQDVHLSRCYLDAQDGESEFCYGCDHVDTMKEKFGLRTFKRQIVLSRCRNCNESASLHEVDAPHKCRRIPSCPGFELEHDEGKLFVPTNVECTEWMVVDTVTGERLPYAVHRATWSTDHRRFQVALLGAPGTVQSDSRDELRTELAAKAESKRKRGFVATDDEPTIKIRKGRKKNA